MSSRSLEPVLQALVRSGILRGVRGAGGGYELAREPCSISAADILRAADAIEDRNSAPFSGAPLLEEVVMPALAQAEQAFSAALKEISVEDLAKSAMARH